MKTHSASQLFKNLLALVSLTIRFCVMYLFWWGQLFDFLLHSPNGLPEPLVKHIMKCLFSAVEALHLKANLFHGEINPERILIGNNYHIKLADCGIAQLMEYLVLFFTCSDCNKMFQYIFSSSMDKPNWSTSAEKAQRTSISFTFNLHNG